MYQKWNVSINRYYVIDICPKYMQWFVWFNVSFQTFGIMIFKFLNTMLKINETQNLSLTANKFDSLCEPSVKID